VIAHHERRASRFNDLAVAFGEVPGSDIVQIVHDFNKDLTHALDKNHKEIEAAARAVERVRPLTPTGVH
jgi:hypothetical protein